MVLSKQKYLYYINMCNLDCNIDFYIILKYILCFIEKTSKLIDRGMLGDVLAP